MCEEQRQKIATLIVEAIWRQKVKIAAQQSGAIEKSNAAIAHDSEHPDYRYAEAFDQFRYRFTDSRRLPWTTVVSDEPLDWLADALRFPGGLA